MLVCEGANIESRLKPLHLTFTKLAWMLLPSFTAILHIRGAEMAQFSTQQDITYSEAVESLALTVKTNGGSLTVSVWDGSEYVLTDTVSVDGSNELFVKGQVMRFTPSGGCTFTIRAGV